MSRPSTPLTGPLAALERTVAERPEALAFIRGDEVVTFAAWRARVDDCAREFIRRGVSPGDRVLVWMDTTPDMGAAVFGAWAVGAIAAIMDPRAGAAHFAHAIETTSPAVVITSGEDPAPVGDHETPAIAMARVPHGGDPLPSVAPPLPTAPASIVFTSGSTGRPKGVTQSHGNLLRGCLAVTGYLATTSADRILCTVPWTFDYGYGQLLTAAVRGSTVIIPTIANPFGMCEAIARHRPTVLAGIPSVFTYLLRGVSPFRNADLSSIRTITNTGGTIPSPVLDDLFGLFPDATVFLNYGLTETYRTSFLDPELARTHRGSIGRGIPGVQVAVVREDGQPADAGELGEIVHRGDYICLGYWNDHEATARAVRPDPFVAAGCPGPPRALFTGDYGVMDEDGLLYFRGRRDQQLKSMGVRVSPAEVEEVLYSSGLVREVAVVGAPHEMIGDEVCAFVVPNDGVERITESVARFARAAMSPYMVPRRIVPYAALPKTATGRIDYPQLRREAQQRLPAGVRHSVQGKP